ncbi:GtrA-like protein [compost metagenome]
MTMRVTPRKIRFSLVSSSATALDFTLLLILTSCGLSTIAANYISSSISFVFSFFANKKFTFRTPNHHIPREAVLFIVITLFGIWVIQPLIIWPVENSLHPFDMPGWLLVTMAKLVASLATFFWNYFFYTRLVFKKKT